MTATSRWVRYPISSATYVSTAKVGTPGEARGSALAADAITIPGSSDNQLKVALDGQSAPAPYQLTLTAGTDLCPRFIARDIQRKVQALYSTVLVDDAAKALAYRYFQCEFINFGSAAGKSQFVCRSGSTGGSSAVSIQDGDSTVLTLLGMNSQTTAAGTVYHRGSTTANTYAGTTTITGTYQGQLDDTYLVYISDDQMITAAVAYGVGNTYGVANGGVGTVAGDWNFTSSTTYVITIDTSNGSTMGGGTGNVPTFTVSDSVGSDDVAVAQELLYADTWYSIGVNGVRIKFTDYPFGNGDTITITCTAASDADGIGSGTAALGAAVYRFSSARGDNSTASVVTSASPTDVGTKGVTVAFTSGTFAAGDEWRVFCRAPAPEAYGVTSMDYGNVTVTTNSAVKVHQFEIMSGAVSLSSVKFSLQSHGTFSHHDAGSLDTEFHFGTVGAGQRGDGGGGAATGPEWPPTTITASDISVDKTGGATGAPVYLYSSKQDLAVVASASNAEDIGSSDLASDFIFTAIKLGAAETGSNSSVNYRLYFDYSS